MKASCACGALTAEVSASPERVSICHCHACRTRTGSAFSLNIRFARKDVTVNGATKLFDRVGDDGGTITYHFCPTCGVTVFYENSGVDGIMIPAGACAPEDLPTPLVSVYHERCPDWITLDQTLRRT